MEETSLVFPDTEGGLAAEAIDAAEESPRGGKMEEQQSSSSVVRQEEISRQPISDRIKRDAKLRAVLASGKQPRLNRQSTIDLAEDKPKRNTLGVLDNWFSKRFPKKCKLPDKNKAKTKEIQLGMVEVSEENGETKYERKTMNLAVEQVAPPVAGSFTKTLLAERSRLESEMRKRRLEGLQKREEQFKSDNPELDIEEEEEEVVSASGDEERSGEEREEEEDEEETETNPMIEDEAQESGNEQQEEGEKSGDEHQPLSLRLADVPETLELDTPEFEDDEVVAPLKKSQSMDSSRDLFGSISSDEDEKEADPRPVTNPVRPKSEQSEIPDMMKLLQRSNSKRSHSFNNGDESMDYETPNFTLRLNEDTLTQFPVSPDQPAIKQLINVPSLDVEGIGGSEAPDELLDLCSGRFSTQTQQPSTSSWLVSDLALDSQPAAAEMFVTNDEDARDGFEADADDESEQKKNGDEKTRKRRRKLIQLSDSDSDSDQDERKAKTPVYFGEEEDDDSDDELAVVRRIEKGIKDKRGRVRTEFVEQEAELSGSDVGSGDEQLGSDFDEYEAEEGDADDVPDEAQLKDQIGKVFIKQQMDQDKRDLILYKDRYLEDGDLHSDVNRRFRWQNNDEATFDNPVTDLDKFEATEADEDVQHEMWTLERAQKTKWMMDNSKKQKGDLNEDSDSDGVAEASNSQLLKLGKMALSRTNSTAPVQNSQNQNTSRPALLPSFSCDPDLNARRSLLNKDSSSLSLLLKSTGSAPRQEACKALYTHISPDKAASRSKRSVGSDDTGYKSKRPKIVNENSNSLFDLFN